MRVTVFLLGPVETVKHAADLYSGHAGTENYCAASVRSEVNAVADYPASFEWDFLDAGEFISRLGMDCFESISYDGKEVPRDNPVVKEFFDLIKYFYEEVRAMVPWRTFEGLSKLRMILSRRGQEVIAQAGMCTEEVSKGRTNFHANRQAEDRTLSRQ